MSTVCVSDDEACEKIRVSLEKCEVDEVIQAFISTKGTGQEIRGSLPRYQANQIHHDTATFIVRRNKMMMPDIDSLNSLEIVTLNSVRRRLPSPIPMKRHHDP